MIYLPKKFHLIIIHTNTTNHLDMSCVNKHQQQRYNNENTKICMFIHCMFVDILFLQQNPLQFSLKVLPHIAKLYIHGQAIMQRVITCVTTHVTVHFLSVQHGFRAICNRLPRVTVNFVKKIYINIFKKELTVTRGSALQIAQHQENLRKNIW